VAAEVTFDVVVNAADAAVELQVRLTGSIDLLVADDHGGIQVVDFKTGATVPSKADTQENTQLGVYQLAVAQGGGQVAEVVQSAGAEAAHPGGGSLVFLAKGVGPEARQASERHQAPLADGAWLDEQVGQAAVTVAGERIVARVSPACTRCDFHPMCPAWSKLDWMDST
jgi:RecB family exonuclease